MTPDVFAVGECVQHRGMVYGLVAPLWEQTQVLADGITGATRCRVHRLEAVDEAQGHGRRPARRWARTKPRRADDEVVVVLANRRAGIYKKLIVRNGTARRRDPAGDVDAYGLR